MFYIGYEKKSLGNLLHFLYYVCGLDVAQHAIIDFQTSTITYRNKPFTIFSYDEEGFPVFTFLILDYLDPIWADVRRQEAIKVWKQHHEKAPVIVRA